MSFVAAAVSASAGISAGASIYGGMQQASAAKDASNAQVDSFSRGMARLREGQNQALAYLDPYRQYGLNAGSSLQAAMYSPEQRQQQFADQRIQLQGEIDRLKAAAPKWDSYQVLTGKNASERRASQFTSEMDASNRQVAEAQAKLATFEKQAASYTSSGASQGPKIQESPWYQFQADLLNRSQDRAFAARGLTGSGFEAEERRKGLLQLGAQETESQFGRMAKIYDVGANAANVGAGILTGTASQIANNEVGIGQAQAQGYLGVAGANAGMATGIANSVTGAVGAGLNYQQFQSLINANAARPSATPRASLSGSAIANDVYRG